MPKQLRVHLVALFFSISAFILQVLALCGSLPSLRSIYFARIDLVVSASIYDRLLNNMFGVPAYLTMATFVVCQGFHMSNGIKLLCSSPSIGYRYNASGILGILEDAIPDGMHTALSIAQAGVLIPSVCLCFLLWAFCVLGCLVSKTVGAFRIYCTVLILAILALIFASGSLAVQVVGYVGVRDGVRNMQHHYLSQSIQLQPAAGPSIWMTVAAVVCLLAVVVVILAESFWTHRKRRQQADTLDRPETPSQQPGNDAIEMHSL